MPGYCLLLSGLFVFADYRVLPRKQKGKKKKGERESHTLLCRCWNLLCGGCRTWFAWTLSFCVVPRNLGYQNWFWAVLELPGRKPWCFWINQDWCVDFDWGLLKLRKETYFFLGNLAPWTRKKKKKKQINQFLGTESEFLRHRLESCNKKKRKKETRDKLGSKSPSSDTSPALKTPLLLTPFGLRTAKEIQKSSPSLPNYPQPYHIRH